MFRSSPRSGNRSWTAGSQLLVTCALTAAVLLSVLLSRSNVVRSDGMQDSVSDVPGGERGQMRDMGHPVQGVRAERQELQVAEGEQQQAGDWGLHADEEQQQEEEAEEGEEEEGGADEEVGEDEEINQLQPKQQLEVEEEQQEVVEDEASSAEADGAAEEGEEEEEQGWPKGPSPYHQALAKCQGLACLTAAAAQAERYPGQFLFPHFFIVGWQKCATTSLFFHLRHHPQFMAAHNKEPEFFSNMCGYEAGACPEAAQKEYIWKTLRLKEVLAGRLRHAGAEASTHYGRNGQLLAPQLQQVFPWLKVIASMREPISRAISMLAHNLDLHSAGCLAKREIYGCLARDLPRQNYSAPFEAWLEAYPRHQIYLVQYENMTSREHGNNVLHEIKRFLRVDPELPANAPLLSRANSRESHLRKKGGAGKGEADLGWPIERQQYQNLVDVVRPDAQRIANLADQHGFADGQQWMSNWEEEWQATLDECDTDGNCIIYPN